MEVKFRSANSDDADVLSGLALRAKAYWPYEKDFIAACADDLKITPARADGGFIVVAETDGQIIGFYGFGEDIDDPEMTHLFLEPRLIGKGVGKKVWRAAIEFARTKKWNSFKMIADPYAAEKFYIPMGCQKIGEVESSVLAGRKLPVLCYSIK